MATYYGAFCVKDGRIVYQLARKPSEKANHETNKCEYDGKRDDSDDSVWVYVEVEHDDVT